MTIRYFVFDHNNEFKWTRADKAYDGDGVLVEVSEDAAGVVTLECAQYYSKDGALRLTITQPLDRALAMFAALLQADMQLELQGGGR